MGLPSNSSWYDTVNIIVMGLLLIFIVPFDIGNMNGIETTWMCVIMCALSYVLGLIYHKIVEWVFNNLLKPIRNKLRLYAKDKAKYKTHYTQYIDDDDYYRFYYMMSREGMLGIVDILEAQIAFLKNSIVMIVVYALFAIFDHFDHYPIYANNKSMFLISAIIIIALSCWTWREITYKRYELVWMGGIHLRQIEQSIKKNG